MNRLQRVLAAAFLPPDIMAADSRYGASDPFSSHDGWLVRMLGGGKTHAGPAVNEWTATHQPVVYACINRICNPIASVPIGIFQKVNGNPVVVNEHPMSQRLGLRPNDYMSSRTLRKVGQSGGLLWGNGYIEIERNGRGQGVGLWPLLPDRSHKKRIDGEILVQTQIDGQSFDIPDADCVHIMDLSHDGYVGWSPIRMARQALGMAAAMEQFGGQFFANDMKSGGFLMHPGKLSSQAHNNLKSVPPDRRAAESERRGADTSGPGGRLERQGGLDNAHRVKVLEEGMKFIQTTIPPEDAQFLGSREFQIAEIARIYDVPLVLLQSHEKSTSWGTGIEQLMIGFITQTVQPWVTAWEQELNWKLFTEQERQQGLYVKFNLKGLLRGDAASRSALYKALFEVAGISPNQICALEEIEPVGDGGDKRFVPVNFRPLDEPPPPPAPPAPPPAPANAPQPEDQAA